MQAIRSLVVTVQIYILELLAGVEGKLKKKLEKKTNANHSRIASSKSGHRTSTCSQKKERRRANADRQGLRGRD